MGRLLLGDFIVGEACSGVKTEEDWSIDRKSVADDESDRSSDGRQRGRSSITVKMGYGAAKRDTQQQYKQLLCSHHRHIKQLVT